MRVKVFTSTIRGTETIFLAEDKPSEGNIKKTLEENGYSAIRGENGGIKKIGNVSTRS
jgi:hypothetical protein